MLFSVCVCGRGGGGGGCRRSRPLRVLQGAARALQPPAAPLLSPGPGAAGCKRGPTLRHTAPMLQLAAHLAPQLDCSIAAGWCSFCGTTTSSRAGWRPPRSALRRRTWSPRGGSATSRWVLNKATRQKKKPLTCVGLARLFSFGRRGRAACPGCIPTRGGGPADGGQLRGGGQGHAVMAATTVRTERSMRYLCALQRQRCRAASNTLLCCLHRLRCCAGAV